MTCCLIIWFCVTDALVMLIEVRGGFGQELRQICTSVSFEFTAKTYMYNVSDTGISKI